MKFNISISIVTYNNEKEIQGVLSSIYESNISKDIDVYVVDNCSQDHTIRIIEKEFKGVKVLKNLKNLGYGKGHNEAIKITQSKYHFIINPDIKFDQKLLECIVRFLELNDDVAMCIPNIHDIDGKLKYPPKKDPRIRYLIGRYLVKYGGKFKKWSDEYGIRGYELCNQQPFEIEFCSGSFMATRTETLKLVNGFDERYFLYFEDADLSRKIRKYGRVMCVPEYIVQHEGKHESHKSFKGFRMMVDSLIKYFNKWGWKF